MTEEETKDQPQLGLDEAADVLLGEDPTKDWTPEQRAEVAAIMATLDPPKEEPKRPEYDCSKHFKVGERINGHEGIKMRVIGTSKAGIRVALMGKRAKRLKWLPGHTLVINGQAFVITAPRQKEAFLQYMGPDLAMLQAQRLRSLEDAAFPESTDEPSTMAEGDNQ